MDVLTRIDLEIETIIYDLKRRSEQYTGDILKQKETVRQANGHAVVVTEVNLKSIDNAVDLLISNYIAAKADGSVSDSLELREDFRRLRAWMDVLYWGVCNHNADSCRAIPGEYSNGFNEMFEEIDDKKNKKLVSCLD